MALCSCDLGINALLSYQFLNCETKDKNKCVFRQYSAKGGWYNSRNGTNPMVKGEILQSSDLIYNIFRQMFMGKYRTIQYTNLLQGNTPQMCIR